MAEKTAINTKNTDWNLTLLCAQKDPDVKEGLEEVRKESYEFINKWKGRKDYLSDPEVLKKALDEYEAWNKSVGTDGDIGYYYWLKSNLDQSNPEIRAKMNLINDVATQIGNDIQFFEHRIAKVDKETQKKFLESDLLSDYHHFLEGLFESARYLLEEEQEKIVNLMSPMAYSNWVKMVSTFISETEKEVLNENEETETKGFSDIATLINSQNKKVRDVAAKAFNEIMQEYVDLAENELNSVLQHKKVQDKLRDVPRPDKGRHVNDDIDTEVVDTLIEAVTEGFEISKKYYDLKSKLLGVDKLEYHERNVRYGEIDKEYSYGDAVTLISQTLKNLDETFAESFQNFVENGHLDVFPKKGKRPGAFAVQNMKTQPIYIMLNYTRKLNDVTTIAHELGHAVNFKLIQENENALNASSPLSTAEVASTFFEDFVLQTIWEEADEELQLALMMMKLNDEISTIHRQIAEYKFEQEIHEKFREAGYLSKQAIGKLFQKHMEAYMGPYVEQSEGSENWWVYWSHTRRYFYVYSYASGLLISKAFQKEVKENPEFVKNVKKFLSTGSSKSPKDIFAEMNVDITKKVFWQNGLSEVRVLLEKTEQLAKKLGKI